MKPLHTKSFNQQDSIDLESALIHAQNTLTADVDAHYASPVLVANLPSNAATTTIASPTVEPPVVLPSPATLPHRRPVKLILLAAGAGAIAALCIGSNWWHYASTHVETDNATVAGHIHPISARIPGTIQQVLVNDNQWVQSGQLLLRLDPRDYQQKLQQAQADLAAAQQKATTAKISIALSAKNAQATSTQSQGDLGKAQAAIAEAQAKVAGAQAGVSKSQAQLAESTANLQKAQADLKRFTDLYRAGAIAQRDLDTARQAYQVAQAQQNADEQGVQQAEAQVAQAQQAVETANAGLGTSQGELQQAEAKEIQTEVSQSDYGTAKAAIAQAQVALQNAQLQLSYTTIAAPTSGRIGRKTVEVGQQIQAGTPLLALVNNDYWVTANFKETQLERMRPGQPVEIVLDAFPHKKFAGRIDSISPASGAQFALLPPDNATGNFTKVVQRVPVKVVFNADSLRGYESRITPGMSAIVTVTLN
jgi:membrane fusion protein (multidrug efflux system)